MLYVYLFLMSLIGNELMLLKVRREGCSSFLNGPVGYILVKIYKAIRNFIPQKTELRGY